MIRDLRTLLAFICVFSIILPAFAGGDVISYGPDGVNHFELSTQKILLKFQKGISIQEKMTILRQEKAVLPLKAENILPAPDVTIAEVQGLDEAGLKALLQRLQANHSVEYANPFLVYTDGTLQGIQDRAVVRLKSANDLDKLKIYAQRLQFQIVERDDYDANVYILGTTKNSKGNALEVANALYESQQFDWAEPDFLLLLKRFSTNDTYLGYQWSLNNTGSSIQFNGTAGADLNVFSAWGLTHGSSSIKVAIIDEGVDLAHPDLLANLLGGYDATGQNSGGAPSGNDAHGTSCAGIVAAVGNNSLGVAGIAYGSKIVPVRIAYSSGNNWVTSNTWIGNAINWSWSTGAADVLSNSWGGGSSSSTINNAINAAVTSGRGGLGSPVLFAAGNDNGAVSYPATQANTISVAAMSMCYERKSLTSCDGETWWGSNYGTNVDVAAPGVKIYTTDISGSSGYSTGNYVANFNGTSSATPNAAGVMALILSANPGLTQAQARNAMETTCRKVGGYTYNANVSGQPNGTWSTNLGYGLINAYQAVLSVAPTVQNDAGISAITAPSGTLCTNSISPVVKLNNFGSNTITSATINYRVDNGAVLTYNWAGTLASAANTTINLPSQTVAMGSHTFSAYTSNPNGNTDGNASNDAATSSFVSANIPLTLSIVLDKYGSETTWEIRNGSSQVVASGGPYADNINGTVVTANMCVVDGCYSFIIYDSYGDGICCAYGNGSYQLRNSTTNAVLASGGSFNASQTTNFCVQSTVPLAASISSSTNVSCNGGNNGTATVTATYGTSPYTYLWSNGSTSASVTGLAAGTYTVTVTDNASATATASVAITAPPVLSSLATAAHVSCFGGSDGAISLLTIGGTAPYTYLWGNSSTNQNQNGLSAGSYTVTVTDAKGCTTSASASVTEPSAINLSASASPSSCGNDGAVDLSVTGGIPSYTYLWSNGTTTEDLSSVSEGTYDVTVTDANGCTATTSTVVGQVPTLEVSTSVSDVSCFGGSDGTASLLVAGGTTPYSYSWSNGATTANLSSLSASTYTVTVTDANGCTTSTTIALVETSNLSASASSTNATCFGNSDGVISVSAFSEPGIYSYNWSNGESNSFVLGIAAGIYTVTVTDNLGCTIGASTVVGQPAILAVSLSSTDEGCGFNDASASVSAIGGTSPYTYLWSNGGNSATITGLASGVYSVTVSDANGCSTLSSIEVVYNCVSCTYTAINTTDFESGWGIWNDGGDDCFLRTNGTYASSGSKYLELRDNSGEGSSATTNMFNWSNYDELTVAFSYITVGVNNWREDLWLQVSNDGGLTFTTVEEWNWTDEFQNNVRYNEQVVIPGPFSTLAKLRFVCDASANSDLIYLDDIVISGCDNGVLQSTCADGFLNGDETEVDCGGSSCDPCPATCNYVSINENDFEGGLGIWGDGGSDCALVSNLTYANSGTRSVELRDNTLESVMTTSNLNLANHEELTINFSYIANNMDNANEDFWLQVSYNGGATFSTFEEWNLGDEFVNNQRYDERVTLAGPFTANTQLRFRCHASGDNDWVYIDDVMISGCLKVSARFADSPEEAPAEAGQLPIAERGFDALDIYPNPAVNQVNLVYTSYLGQKLELVVSNMFGQIVYQETKAIREGENKMNIDLSNLADGVYMVSFIGIENRVSQRLVIQK